MLITKSEILDYRQISKSVAEAKINPFITDAEILDLLPLLGEKFFYEIKTNPNEYQGLLNETSYLHDGYNVISYGLKRVLVDFAYARYVMFGSQTDTPFGMVEKQYQDGVNVGRVDRKEIYKQTQQIAYQYWSSVELYLNRNVKQYPLWGDKYCVATQRKGFRINKITR